MNEPTPSKKRLTVGGIAKRVLRSLLLTYFLILIVLTFLQRQLLYHPRKAKALPVATFNEVTRIFPGSQDIELACDDGATIRGWLLRTSSDSEAIRRPLVLYFHGNAGNRAGRVNWYQLFHESGADVLAIDYHGYGDSEGKMNEGALELSSDAAWRFATRELAYRPTEIIVVGTSLGGAAAVYITSRQSENGAPPSGLAVVATFSTMVDVASSLYPWLPVRAVLVDRYPSEDRIKNVSSRVVVIHGEEDTLVQPRFGKQLFDASPKHSADGTAKKWLPLPGVGHNDILGGARREIQAEIEQLVAAAATPAD